MQGEIFELICENEFFTNCSENYLYSAVYSYTYPSNIYTKEGNSRFSSFFFLSELNYFKNKFVSKIYNKIKNGNTIEQKGAISKSGFETYPDIQIYSEPFITGWIPGGCVMHYKSNLVLYNFFPFSGKAYCEDLYHSIALKKNNLTPGNLCAVARPANN